jgi:membrane associated rhomboid family serine protease
MAECDVCGEQVSMPYQCRHCGGTHCAEHRLPESHSCPAVDQWEQEGAVFESTFDDTVEAGGSQSEGVAGRLGIDTGPGGPLSYFRNNMTYVFLGAMWVTFALQLVVLSFSESLHETLFVFSSENPLFVWTWVTSIFAHGGFIHIVFNSIVIYFFGRLVERYIGWKKFALLFLVSGILAGVGQVGFQILQGADTGVVGASGAALALLGVLTILNPNLTVYLYFIIPMPIWVLTGGTVAISLLLIVTGAASAGGIAHVAHLIGVLLGLAYGYRVRDQIRVPSQLRFGGGGGPGGPGGGPGGPGGPGRGRF